MWGEASKMATQAAPPPPKVAGLERRVSTWGPAKMTRQDPPRPATYHVTGGGGKKWATRHFSNRIISRYLFHTIDVQCLPLPYCSVKVCLSPFYEL